MRVVKMEDQWKGCICPMARFGTGTVELVVSATRQFMSDVCWHLGQQPSEHIQVTQQPIFSDMERL
jgi:hypothetical protein